ncbi:MAG: hypothetical protein EPN53_02875 [Acidobacteria bacterium]|nr:MAG: hypothetical protein EPN53_02875 [Acidobacteriota bacterium]
MKLPATGLASRELSRDQGAIAGVTINASEQTVLKALGQPVEVQAERDGITEQRARRLIYEGLVVYLVEDKVQNLKCSAPAFATADGVRVGDPVAKLLAVYGGGERYRVEKGEILRYRLSGSDVYLVFHLLADRVTMVELWFDYT